MNGARALALAVGSSACGETGSGTGGATDGTEWICGLEPEAVPELPTCATELGASGPAVLGSGATWCVDISPSEPVTIDDGPVRLVLEWIWDWNWEPDGCEPIALAVRSARSEIPEDGGLEPVQPLSPVYEIRVPDPLIACSPGLHLSVAVGVPDAAVAGCGATVTRDTHGYGWTSAIDLFPQHGQTLAVFAARPCPSSPICGGACRDLSIDESHCGACDAPCDALCQEGGCAGVGLGNEPEGEFASDGTAVYFTDGERARRISVVGGAPVAEDFAPGTVVRALDARDGRVASVERSAAGLQLRRRDADGERTTPLPSEDGDWLEVRLLPEATVVANPDGVPPLVAIDAATGTVTPLSSCFSPGGVDIWIRGLGADGPQLLVVGDDSDADPDWGDLWRCAVDGSAAAELAEDGIWGGAASGRSLELWFAEGDVFLTDEQDVYRIRDGMLDPTYAPWLGSEPWALDGDTAYARRGYDIVRVPGEEPPIFVGIDARDLAVLEGMLIVRDGERDGVLVALQVP